MIRKAAEERVHFHEPDASRRVALAVLRCFRSVFSLQSLVVLCIGTDRSTGDALGPLVGTNLARADLPMTTVLGTLDDPVHAGNLVDVIRAVESSPARPFVVAVDACLGRSDQVGSILVGAGPLRPGAGVHKSLPLVGNAFVTGTVNVGGFMEYLVLQNTRLSVVMKMAEVISNGLVVAILNATSQPSFTTVTGVPPGPPPSSP